MQSKRAWIWIALLAVVAVAGVLFYRSSHTPPKSAQQSASTEPAKTAETKTGGTDTDPKIVAPVRDPDNPVPDYPTFAMRRHQEGAVFLDLHIGRDGKIKEAKILKSSGFNALDMSALDTVSKKWRYSPATRNGKPVTIWHKVKITFACQSEGQDICNEERMASGH